MPATDASWTALLKGLRTRVFDLAELGGEAQLVVVALIGILSAPWLFTALLTQEWKVVTTAKRRAQEALGIPVTCKLGARDAQLMWSAPTARCLSADTP
jgi:hypothetical protein